MDLAANAKLISGVLRPKGRVIVYGTGPEATIPAAFCLFNSLRLQFFLVYELDAKEREHCLEAYKRRSQVRHAAQPHCAAHFLLADTVAAHEAVERGTIGNVIVTL